MENLTVACIQMRMSIPPTHDEFEAGARRFLRIAQAKAARLTIFPELTGVMLAPPLISGFKLEFIKRDDQGKQRGAGFLSRRLGRVAGSTAGALGGGFRGSLDRLLRKNGDALRDAYMEMFGRLAREFGTAIVGGSLYVYDGETDTITNRAYVFDADGEVMGYQDKLNLAPDEQALASPGTVLRVLHTRYGRLGLLLGRDALYPELARLLSVQGADLLIGIGASPGAAQGKVIRSALALRAEENQVYCTSSFVVGPNHLGKESREDFYGQSALMAPISMTAKGDGILTQVGTDHTEGVIVAELEMEELYDQRESCRFRPRREMHLGNVGPELADFYLQGLTIEEAIAQTVAPEVEPMPELEAYESEAFEAITPDEPILEDAEPEAEASYTPIPEALSLTSQEEPEPEE